jgi:hypothetical protein
LMGTRNSGRISVGPLPPRTLEVGVNYAWPWNKFGVYFGSGEHRPTENPEYDVWLDNLSRNLDVLKNMLGIRTVRIFLFGNAWNFGRIVPNPSTASKWEFELPDALHPAYLSQLDRMLKEFDTRDMMVIPSLLSFEALAIWNSQGGRGELALDPVKRDKFFDVVLGPFLEVSTHHRAAIRYWEVVNEPGQVTDSLETGVSRRVSSRTDYYIPADAMRAFLNKAIDRIERNGFGSTVGHWVRGDMGFLPTGSARQFHYYPQSFERILGGGHLPPFADTQAFIGEFAADKWPPEQTHSMLWPDIPNEDPIDGTVRTFHRLKLCEEKGYKLALLWPDLSQDFDPARPWLDPVRFTSDVQRGIQAFQGRLLL